MAQRITQVDAFTAAPFAGNPAAVCVLPAIHDDGWMQNVAKEMNLSETAFLVRQADGFSLRWFTPTVEMALCGHATLASAHVLWEEGHLAPDAEARFHTLSGLLTATLQDGWITMNLPTHTFQPIDPPPALGAALHVTPLAVVKGEQADDMYLVEVESEEIVRALAPDFASLATLPGHGIIVTSRATASPAYDFVSRFFAPKIGIDEDPVTGAAHCYLTPYWAHKLGKEQLNAYQASPRGGVLRVRLDGARTWLSGQAVTVLRGELAV